MTANAVVNQKTVVIAAVGFCNEQLENYPLIYTIAICDLSVAIGN